MTSPSFVAAQATASELTGVAGWIIDLIDRFGSIGVGAIVFIENLFPPIPSEAVLPAAGYLAGVGRLGFAAVLIWSTIGSVRKAIFFGRLIPGVRSLISIPAGAKRMPLLPFVALTAAGSFLWNLLLVSSGYWLGDRWGQTAAVSHWANIGVVVAGLAAAIWWLKGPLGRTVDA